MICESYSSAKKTENIQSKQDLDYLKTFRYLLEFCLQ